MITHHSTPHASLHQLSKRVRDGLASSRSRFLASMESLASCGLGACESTRKSVVSVSFAKSARMARAVRSSGQDEPAQRQEFEAVGQVSGRARLLPRQCTSKTKRTTHRVDECHGACMEACWPSWPVFISTQNSTKLHSTTSCTLFSHGAIEVTHPPPIHQCIHWLPGYQGPPCQPVLVAVRNIRPKMMPARGAERACNCSALVPHRTMMPTISPDSPRPERSKTVEKPGVGIGQTHQQFIFRKASGMSSTGCHKHLIRSYRCAKSTALCVCPLPVVISGRRNAAAQAAGTAAAPPHI